MAAPTYLPLERPEPRAMLSRPKPTEETSVGVMTFLAALFGLGLALYLLSLRRR